MLPYVQRRRRLPGSVSSVIAGATSPEQVSANVHATGWRLDAQETAELAAMLEALP